MSRVDQSIATLKNGNGASKIGYTPAVNTDWDGDVDPGDVDDALDQLAERVDDNEITIASNTAAIAANAAQLLGQDDASEITYTPATLANWTGSADPGNVDGALDQLASRTKTVESSLGAYSSGSFTPAIQGSASSPTMGYTNQWGYYERVGNLVFVAMGIDISSISGGSGDVRISGLPFDCTNVSSITFLNSVRLDFVDIDADTKFVTAQLQDNNGYMVLVQSKDNADSTLVQISGLSTSSALFITGCYITDAA